MMMVLLTFSTGEQINRSFADGGNRFDIVIGARGGDTQVVLNALFFSENPSGVIPFEIVGLMEREYGTEGVKRAGAMRRMVPLAMGDSVRGHRIVGTTNDYFEDREIRNGRLFSEEYTAGQGEAILGHNTARRLGLGLGDTFFGAHDIVDGDGGHGHDGHGTFPYTVVGILRRSGTSDDDVAFCRIEAVWEIHGFCVGDCNGSCGDGEGNGEDEDCVAPIVAVLIQSSDLMSMSAILSDPHFSGGPVRPRAPDPDEDNYAEKQEAYLVALEAYLQSLEQYENGPYRELFREAKVISTREVVRNVMSLFGSAQTAIIAILVMVIVITFNMLFLAMFTAASEKQKDFAILRALGANKSRIFLTIVLEAVFIALTGIFAGFLLSKAGLSLAGIFVRGLFGLRLSPFTFFLAELWIMLAGLGIAVIAAVIPAIKVYRTEPSKYLC
jgi:putative ABC transport system permease protein